MKGMNMIEIAQTAGCSYRTVKTYAKRLWPTVSWRNRRLTETEASALMEALPKREMVQSRGKSAPREGQNSPSIDIAEIIRDTIRELLPAIVAAIRGTQEGTHPAALTALPAPAELDPRDALRKIVDNYARAHGRDFQGAWSNLYTEYAYRYHRDIRRAAKNRNQAILDYADAENIVGELLALAYFLYGQKAAASA